MNAIIIHSGSDNSSNRMAVLGEESLDLVVQAAVGIVVIAEALVM